MNERFVIAIFVKRIKLQISVQKKRVAGFAFRDDDALIRRTFSVNDVVDKQSVFGERSQMSRL